MSAKPRKTRRENQSANSASANNAASTRARTQTSRVLADASPQTSRESAPPRFVLPLLIFVFVALTCALIGRVPLNAAPDEAAHFLYVERLAQSWQLPVFAVTSANAPGYEFHQPPLYYAVCALLWKISGAGVQNYLCRGVSMLCGVFTLILLWRAARLIFPNRPRVAVVATGFAALWPLHIGVCASAGNDAMAGLVCAAIFYQMARIFCLPASTRARDFLLLGALCGLGLLAKTTCLVVAFAALGAAWFAPQNSEREVNSESAANTENATKNVAPPLALLLTFAAMLLIGGPWLVRNTMLYGDPLAQGAFNRAFSQSSPGPHTFFAGGVAVSDYLRALLTILFCTFWGIFGGPNNALKILNPFGARGASPEAFPAMIPALLCLLLMVFALWGVVRFARDAWKNQPMKVRRVLAWWLLGALGVVLAWAQFNTHYFQAQARYFHPALLPIALLFALGWLQLFAPPLPAQNEEIEDAAPLIFLVMTAVFALTLLSLSLWNIVSWRTLV